MRERSRTSMPTHVPTRKCLLAVIAASIATVGACSRSAEPTDARAGAGSPATSAPPAEAPPPTPAPDAAAVPPAPSRDSKEVRTGPATFIADRFNGRKTASGETYDGSRLVAAHASYPLGTVVRVTNPDNGRAVDVKVIDRSAVGAKRPIIDLSRAAAEQLDIVKRGTAPVTVEVLEWGPKGTR